MKVMTGLTLVKEIDMLKETVQGNQQNMFNLTSHHFLYL